jgi:hypothetical protein
VDVRGIASLRPSRVSAFFTGGAPGCWLRTPGVDPEGTFNELATRTAATTANSSAT